MKEYRKVVTFEYNKNKYNMYLDNNNKRFFLKVDDEGNLYYITTKELLMFIKMFSTVPTILEAKGDFSKNKIKIVPKVLSGGIAVILSVSTLTSCVSAYNEEQLETEGIVLISEENARNYISTDEVFTLENLTVDSYSEYGNNINIYDMDYIDLIYDKEKVSINDVINVINDNQLIAPKFKELLYEYCVSLNSNYPDVELRVLYENLKTLEIKEVSEKEIAEVTGAGSLGCYDRVNNVLYMLDYYTYEKGSWQYEIFFHEMSHCLRTRYFFENGKNVKIQVEGENFTNVVSAEALNSLFAVDLLPYKENNITYQLQSNYFNVMLECMDNYELLDYANHSVSYFAKKLDEYNNDDNYATVILELMQIQYEEYHGIDNHEIDNEKESTYLIVGKEEYYPIYDYIAKMYYDKYITSDMTYDEMEEVADKLVRKISINVPEKYNIDYNRFYEALNVYKNMEGQKVRR